MTGINVLILNAAFHHHPWMTFDTEQKRRGSLCWKCSAVKTEARDMMKVLIAYASMHGSTEEAARFIKRILDAFNLDVTVAAVQDVESVTNYDAFILGSAIEGGMWLHEMSIFMERFG